MIMIKSPGEIPDIYREKTQIFLAGSIEMGVANGWQESVAGKLEQAIKNLPVGEGAIGGDQLVLLNPRRDDWGSSWQPVREDPHFRQQVRWELSSLDQANWILMYFDPATKSPISLLELGLHASSGKLVVVCPDGFWRKGNVDMVCEVYPITQRETLEDACRYIVEQENLKRLRAAVNGRPGK
jgi:hypothetical protein